MEKHEDYPLPDLQQELFVQKSDELISADHREFEGFSWDQLKYCFEKPLGIIIDRQNQEE